MSKTYNLRSNTTAISFASAMAELQMDTGTAASAISGPHAITSAALQVFAWITPAGEPNNAAWPAGSGGDPYQIQIDVTTMESAVALSSVWFHRTDAAGAEIQNSSAGGSWDSNTGTGLKTFTNTAWSPSAGSATDRFGVSIWASTSNVMMTNTIAVGSLNTSTSAAHGPWVDAPPPSWATRFYISTVPVRDDYSTGWDSAWDLTNTVEDDDFGFGDVSYRRYLVTAKDGTDSVRAAAVSETSSSVLNGGIFQAVSEPLAAQTISGLVRSVFAARQGSTGTDMRSQIVIRVVSNDGSTVRGTLLAADTGSLTNEWKTGTPAQTRLFPKGDADGASLTSVEAQEGDRLVVEIGYRSHNTSTLSAFGVLDVGNSEVDDWDVNETQNEDGLHNGWIEFDHEFEFSTTGPQAVVAQLLSNAPSIHDPVVVPPDQSLVSQLISQSVSVENPSAAATLSPVVVPLHSNARSVDNPIVVPPSATAVAQLISSLRSIYSPTVVPPDQSVVSQLLSNLSSLGDPSALLAQSVIAELLANSRNIYSPEIVAGGVDVVVPILVNSRSIYQPVVLPGAVSILVETLNHAPVLYEPAISQGGVSIVAQLISTALSVYDTSVLPGIVTVQPDELLNGHQGYEPSLIHKVAVELAANPPTVYGHKLLQSVDSDLLSAVIEVYDPATLPGGVQVVVQLLNSTLDVHSPEVTVGALSVVAQSISEAPLLYDPGILSGEILVLVESLSQLLSVHNSTVTGDKLVDVGDLENTAQTISPGVLAGAVTVINQLLQNPSSLFDHTTLQAQTVVSEALQNGVVLYLPQIDSGAVIQVGDLDSGVVALDPEVLPGGVQISVEPLNNLLQILSPLVVPPIQAVEPDSLSVTPAVELPMVLAGSVVVQAESLDAAPMVYGPTVYFDQFIVVGIINNPAILNGPRLFVGIVPTNWQWSSQDDFSDTRESGFHSMESDFRRTK